MATHHTAPLMAPYLRLWAAVLHRVVKDATSAARGRRRLRRPPRGSASEVMSDAERWIFDGATAPASFLWVCSVLGHDPDAVRQRVLEIYTDGGQQEGS